jgi:hypothetical protein
MPPFLGLFLPPILLEKFLGTAFSVMNLVIASYWMRGCISLLPTTSPHKLIVLKLKTDHRADSSEGWTVER